jgi:hypothetical protein
MSIYVEILVRAPIDALWAHTQTPALHEQWDLRFSKIDYVPRVDECSPQRFRYATRIGLGLEVVGEGETTGQRELPDGSSTSALKFSSAAPLSIIREGSGYWKYTPTRDGVRFVTCYDYRTRFGPAGAIFDRLVFRPLIGWATAWSFDRLRLWIEERLDPRVAVRQTLIHVAARVALAIVFAYQLGVLELALAAMLLVNWSRRWPAWLCLFAMPMATMAFNPFWLNVSVAAIAAIDLFVIGSVPSAGRCRRRLAREHR